MSNPERREYDRFDNTFNVRITKKIKKDDVKDYIITIGTAYNISGSGILITVPEQLEQGEVIRLTFLKPNCFEFFDSIGKVVRIIDQYQDDNFMLGIHFSYLTKSEKDRLHYYICRNE